MLSMNDDATNNILETAAHDNKEIFQRVDPSKYFRFPVSKAITETIAKRQNRQLFFAA